MSRKELYGASFSFSPNRKLVVGLMITFLMMAGCAGNYGRLEKSKKVTDIFESASVLSGYNYFYFGAESRPEAIIALKNEYTLDTKAWTAFEPNDTNLKKWMEYYDFHYKGRSRFYPYGHFIRDQNDNMVGVWYSIHGWTTIKLKEDNHIDIYPPMMEDPYQDSGDDFQGIYSD